MARAGLEPGTAGLRVRRADHSARLSHTRHGWPVKKAIIQLANQVEGKFEKEFIESVRAHNNIVLMLRSNISWLLSNTRDMRSWSFRLYHVVLPNG